MSRPLTFCLALQTILIASAVADDRSDAIKGYIGSYKGDYSAANVEKIKAAAEAHGVSANEITNYVQARNSSTGYQNSLKASSADTLFEKVSKAYIRNYDRLTEIP